MFLQQLCMHFTQETYFQALC